MEIKKFTPTNHKVKALIYGASGTGKTVFAATAPKAIFASAEGGLLSVADKAPDFVEVKSLKDLTDLFAYLKNEKHGYETVIIDSITEINDVIKQEIEKKKGGAMKINDWGELGNKIKKILRDFRDLPMHVLFIAQEIVEKDEGKVTKIIPSLNGKAATEIAYFMDVVGYLFIDKDGERKIVTIPHEKLLTKDRTSLIKSDVEINFSKWVELAQSIKTGVQEVQASFEEVDEEEVMKDEKARKELFASWHEFRKLSMDKKPLERGEDGLLKYAPHTEDPARKAIMKNLYGVESTKELSFDEVKDFATKLKGWSNGLKRMQTPKVESIEDTRGLDKEKRTLSEI